MAIAGNVELLVTPEVLNDKANEVEKHVASMRRKFEEMKTLAYKSAGYWKGDAGDLHRKSYSDQEEIMDFALKRLEEHSGDLRSIAQTYTNAELRVEESMIQSLPGDVL